MDPNRLRELIEATRPGDADQGLSEVEALELRELLADDAELQVELTRIHAWDHAVGAVVDDVPIPAGLADRLRATVDRELAVQPASHPVADAPIRLSRGRWLVAALASAAALFLAVGLGSYLSQPLVIDVAQLKDETVDLTSDLSVVSWQPAGATYPAAAFPRHVRFKPTRWGNVSTSLDRQAIVFDLVREGAPRAVLVAMQTSAASEELLDHPRLSPQPGTGNVCTEAWQRDGYVYTLVVNGGKARYQYFLRETGSLTSNWR